MIQVRKVLYPTDFSPYSTRAYFYAVGLAESYRATLAVVHVIPPGADDGGRGRDHWRAQLEGVRPGNPAVRVEHVLLEGDPAAEITRYAAGAGVDVIVIVTHGRTGVERLMMGSVAERVMRDAPCSVLVVKLPKGSTTPPPAGR